MYLTVGSYSCSYVFFVPGNHCLWVPSHDGIPDSISKFEALQELCLKIGVFMKPHVLPESGLLVIPLFAWHDCEFSGEPTTPAEYEELKRKDYS